MERFYMTIAVLCGVFFGIYGLILDGILAGALLFIVGFIVGLSSFVMYLREKTKREKEE